MSSSPYTLDRLAKYPLLTAAEEIICGRAVQDMQAVLELNPDGPYSKEEKRIIRHGQRAKDRMVTGNMRWVFTLARKYLPVAISLTFDDLVQEGTIGLIRGVEKFDPERGYKFSTYAYWWIRQGINRGLHSDRMIRLPSNAADAQRKIWKCKDHYLDTYDRYPTFKEIAEYCGLSVDSVKLFVQHAFNAASLDAKVLSVESEAASVGDLIACERDTPWDTAEQIEKEEWLEVLLGKLTAEKRHIVNSHWGLGCREPMTFTKMALKLEPDDKRYGFTGLRKRLSATHSLSLRQMRRAAA